MKPIVQGSRRMGVVAAAVLALSSLAAQASPFVAQGQGVGAPAEGAAIGLGTVITLPAIVTTERTDFLSGLSSSTTEEFNVSNFNAAAILGGNGSISGNGGAALTNFPDKDAIFNGRWDTSSTTQVDAGNNPSGGWFQNAAATTYIEVLLTFTTAQDAVGFYLTDYGDFGASVDLDLYDNNGLVSTQTVGGASASNGSVTFYGVYSPVAFTSFRLRFIQLPDPTFVPDPDCGPDPFPSCDPPLLPRDLIGLDGLILGIQERDVTNPASSPGTLGLIGLGLLAAGGLARRRRV